MVAVEMVEMVNQIGSRNGPLDSHPLQKMVYSNVTPRINGHLQNGSSISVLFTFFGVSILAPHTSVRRTRRGHTVGSIPCREGRSPPIASGPLCLTAHTFTAAFACFISAVIWFEAIHLLLRRRYSSPASTFTTAMTNPDLALRTVPDDKLEDLCRLLSRDVYQPSAIQILYFLLQPAVQHNVQEWSQLGKAIRRSHRHDLQIWTFGIPPDLSSATSSESQKTGQENVWGVAILPTDENFGEARARFWISTEINATMFDKLDQPRWQPDEQSLAVLKTMCRAVFSSFLQRTGEKSIFFNGINQCWTKHLFALGNNTYDGLCSKAVRKFDLHAEIRVECPVGYRIRALEEKDIETVSIDFDGSTVERIDTVSIS